MASSHETTPESLSSSIFLYTALGAAAYAVAVIVLVLWN